MGEFDMDHMSFGFGHSNKHASKLSALTWFLFASALWIFLMGSGIFYYNYHAKSHVNNGSANFFLAVAVIGFLIALIIMAIFFRALTARKTFFEVAHDWAKLFNADNVGNAESAKSSTGLEMSDLLGEYQ